MFPAMVSINFTCYAQTIERRKLAVILPLVDGVGGVVACSLILIPLMKMNGLYIANILKPLGVKVSRIAQGVSMGSELEFTDPATLSKALSKRIDM